MRSHQLPSTGRLAGVTTTAELLAGGVSAEAIRTLVRRGVLVRLGHGVYGRARLVADVRKLRRGEPALRAAAALAVAGPGAVASHDSAALIHGLPLLDRPPANRMALTRPPGATARPTSRAGIRLHTAQLPAAHVTTIAGVPLTTVARTVIDIARTTPFRAGVVTADAALHHGRTTNADLDAVAGACPRWPGISRARQVIAFADALAESPLESIARVAFRDGGLPPPKLQAIVGRDGMIIGRADFLWPEHATIVEADGAVKYDNPHEAIAQLRRDALLRQAGFEVVHITWRELMDMPDQVIQLIRDAFARQATLRRR